jgi:hypothetical protein
MYFLCLELIVHYMELLSFCSMYLQVLVPNYWAILERKKYRSLSHVLQFFNASTSNSYTVVGQFEHVRKLYFFSSGC